jgi:hypothetical protein
LRVGDTLPGGGTHRPLAAYRLWAGDVHQCRSAFAEDHQSGIDPFLLEFEPSIAAVTTSGVIFRVGILSFAGDSGVVRFHCL